jgi:hypothetical protein
MHSSEVRRPVKCRHLLSQAFPMNTLFKLKRVEEAGAWEAPNGERPNRRLYVVSATYRPSVGSGALNPTGRFQVDSPLLRYGGRDDYIKGLGALIATPLLTMEQECAVDYTFTDWEGHTHNLHEEWVYVNGAAVEEGGHDAGNDGMTPRRFKERVDAYVRERRRQGLGLTLQEEHAYLSVDEVVSIRL